MKKLLAAMIIVFSTVGCHIQTAIPVKQAIVTHRHNLPPFKAIELNKNTTIELANGSYAVNITGPEKYLYDDQVSVTNQVLHVGASKSASNTTIRVFAPGLKKIAVTDNAVVNAKDFQTTDLTIIAKNNGAINLEGQYIINRIYQYGNGRINIDWINSDRLFIDSHSSGPICLAGTVNSMIAKLTHNASLDARYLRAQKASVFTTDTAQADITVLDTLEAFATDRSNIYYYKRPRNITVVTKESGNVLRPYWIN